MSDGKKLRMLLQQMQLHGMAVPSERINIAIPNARQVLGEYLEYFLSLEQKRLVWLPEYDRVAGWLADNEGKGVFLYGDCGRGKSLLVKYVIPAILLEYHNLVVKSYDTQQMNRKLDEVLRRRLIGLDDVGTEDVLNDYGNRRQAFAEVVDAAEKYGKLLIVSSNLGKKELLEYYNVRVYERVIATTKRIEFRGGSLRQ